MLNNVEDDDHILKYEYSTITTADQKVALSYISRITFRRAKRPNLQFPWLVLVAKRYASLGKGVRGVEYRNIGKYW